MKNQSVQFKKPSVDYWEQGYKIDDIYSHIAKCARVCYQSEKTNDTESAKKFCERILLKSSNKKANHTAMLEHGTVYLYLKDFCTNGEKLSIYKKYDKNKYSKVKVSSDFNIVYITTNMRVIYENDWFKDLKYLAKEEDLKYFEKRYTFSVITDIGVSREGNRHRASSPAEESTRYCNYIKEKFGGHISAIQVPWLSEEDYQKNKFELLDQRNIFDNNFIFGQNTSEWTAKDWYIYSLQIADIAYNKMVKEWKPQQARVVLPLNTKTQVIYTAFESDWMHFLALRSEGISGVPHPMMKQIADKIKIFFETR